MTRLAFLLWPDTFEDWYPALGLSREDYLASYVGEWSISLTRALVVAGADVHLVHGTIGEAATAVQQPSGATAHFVPTTAAYRGLRWLAWGHRWWRITSPIWRIAPVAAALSFRLLRRLLWLRADAVVVQDYETLRFDIVAPLLRAAGQRVIAMDTGASARPSRAPWKRATRRCADVLLAVHEREAERLRSLGHSQVAVWPAPVRTDIFTPTDRHTARERLGIPEDEPVVFAATRLHPVKNLTLLADACDDAGATLVLAGDGPERLRLERRGSPGLRLLGWMSGGEMTQWYAAADVVALSSNQEGQPIAVLEAFACGRAVVATAVGGVPEVVRDGETGWLVPPRDRSALAAALGKALADRETTDRYGATGHDYVMRRHSTPAVAATFIAICGL
jgi:glycosyltransferase involved in cell wall biosynthesis